MTVDLAARLEGAVRGALVADALGVPYEFGGPYAEESVVFGARGTWSKPPGTWSDDGALWLATLDSLLPPDGVGPARLDLDDHGRRYLAWMETGAYTPDAEGLFDIGGATRSALSRIGSGLPAEEAGGRDERDQGNGSLMRILPLALVDLPAGEDRLLWARRSSCVTHAHPVVQVTCAFSVAIAERLLAGVPRAEALAAGRAALDAHVGTDAELLAALAVLDGHTGRAGRGWVVDSFWSAWDAFAGADDVAHAIRRAVAYGNDTDTTAIIAGGLAGIHGGVDAIPDAWRAGMRGGAVVEPILARLRAHRGVAGS